jgi:ribosomal protein S18 acetylase RimI-like enzyme
MRDPIEIVVEGPDVLSAYASIPIAYQVTEVLDLDSPSAAGELLPFVSRTLEPPRIKDYDAAPGEHPMTWPARFDIRDWGFLGAYSGERRVGGAVIVRQNPDVEMLDGRDDLALLWDIRVSPTARQLGVGSALLAAGESWARARGARELKVETQNTNVPACRFYASRGFVLRAVHRGAYPAFPDEVQLLWYKHLEDHGRDPDREHTR